MDKITWDILSNINCNNHTEKKNNLTYLSWAWAWGITKKHFPNTSYKVVMFDNVIDGIVVKKPYLFDEHLGYLVQTEVTINGETLPMQLFVMDGANNAQKHIRYSYLVNEWANGKKTGKMIDKYVEPATMFDINTTIMRCLTKNLALFGLGHYIYAGEDLPPIDLDKIASEINDANNINELKDVYNANVTAITKTEKLVSLLKAKQNSFK